MVNEACSTYGQAYFDSPSVMEASIRQSIATVKVFMMASWEWKKQVKWVKWGMRMVGEAKHNTEDEAII